LNHIRYGKISPLAESLYAGLGRISYEWNHLEDAEKYSQQSLALSNCWGSFATQAAGFVMLAGLEHARGSLEKSQEYMRLAEPLMDQHPLSTWRSNSPKSDLARLLMAQGNLDKAAG
jgi:ATP/maltotriose-dependent transcriptional regulator MalT